MSKSKILFICKKRHLYGSYSYTSTGIITSIKFLVNMLNKHGIESKAVEVVDNNSIDKEVHDYKPTHVIIEALWVVPEKFEILQKLHPNVIWVVRIHSEIPFIAIEGNSISWIKQYHALGVQIASNSERMVKSIEEVLNFYTIYLPNYYELCKNKSDKQDKHWIDIGCLGAVRPLKNSLIQAFAAIKFANYLGHNLHFHVNTTRIENHGDPVVKNLRALFEHQDHVLIEHEWLKRDKFLELMKKMDISMQVSFSESYNIVTADAVSQNVPVVTSPEIKFVSSIFHADPTDMQDIYNKLWRAYIGGKFRLQILNKIKLKCMNKKVVQTWLKLFKCDE